MSWLTNSCCPEFPDSNYIIRNALGSMGGSMPRIKKQDLTDPMIYIDKSDDKACEQSKKAVCNTSPLIDGFYLCNIDAPDCEYAFSYGFSHLCRSPNRHEYSKR